MNKTSKFYAYSTSGQWKASFVALIGIQHAKLDSQLSVSVSDDLKWEFTTFLGVALDVLQVH